MSTRSSYPTCPVCRRKHDPHFGGERMFSRLQAAGKLYDGRLVLCWNKAKDQLLRQQWEVKQAAMAAEEAARAARERQRRSYDFTETDRLIREMERLAEETEKLRRAMQQPTTGHHDRRSKLEKLEELARRGATEHERASARAAIQRLKAR